MRNLLIAFIAILFALPAHAIRIPLELMSDAELSAHFAKERRRYVEAFSNLLAAPEREGGTIEIIGTKTKRQWVLNAEDFNIVQDPWLEGNSRTQIQWGSNFIKTELGMGPGAAVYVDLIRRLAKRHHVRLIFPSNSDDVVERYYVRSASIQVGPHSKPMDLDYMMGMYQEHPDFIAATPHLAAKACREMFSPPKPANAPAKRFGREPML